MKTRIFAYLFALSIFVLGASVASAAAVIPLSSGIKDQSYSLEWCSPHASRLDSNPSPSPACRSGQFQNVGGVATIKYDGKNFPSGNIGPEVSVAKLIPTTRTAQTTAGSPPLVDFFSGITGGAFSLEGEGVLTLRVLLVDYAENVSFYRVVYKIDKTGPQLTFTDITENTDYTYYGGRVNASVTVEKNDGSFMDSLGDSYRNPIIGSYSTSDVAMARKIHTRNNLHAFYFQNSTVGAGASSPFVANTVHSDDYNGYMVASATSPIPGGYSGPLVSGEKGFQLVTEAGSPVSTIGSLSAAYTTANLTDVSTNSQRKYRLRLYDGTVSDGGTTGNYSETAFYVVRDNMSPNLGGNGLGATVRDASEMLLSFADNQTVYDRTAYPGGYIPESNGVSRFFAAAKGMQLNYKLNDTGITGDGVTTGTGCTDFRLCNAGIDGASVRVNIEDADSPGQYPVFTDFTDRFVNSGTKPKNFDKVDNALVSNGTYRKYGVKYTSNASAKLCDYVGNCIAPELAFRVVANTLDNSKSNLTITTNSSTPDGKIVANGTHAYALSYALQDANGNRVVPVVSMENAGSPQIKAVDSTVTFQNGLYENLLKNSGGSGDRLVKAKNLKPNISFADSINANGVVSMTEGIASQPYGVYAMALSSSVPTNGAYPYVMPDAKLKVQALDNKTDRIQAAGAMTYPTAGSRMGYGQMSATTGNTDSLVNIDRGGIGESVGFQNITLNQANYGKVSYNNANQIPFSALPTRSPNFEFASPYVYGLVGMRVLIDGQYGDHFKKLYTIDPSLPNYNVYEKYVVAYNTDKDEQPGVLDYKIRASSASPAADIGAGVRYTSNGNFPIFGAGMVYQPYDIGAATGSGYYAEVQMSSRPDRTYDNTKLRTGFVSAITYQVGANTVRLPSVGRGLTKLDGTSSLDQYEMVRNYFDDTYTIGKGANTPATLSATLNDIAIIGLSNRYNTITTDVTGSQKNVNVEGELNRTSLISNIKQNVASVSRGFGPRTNTSGKRWCGNGSTTTTISNIYSSAYDDCSIVINGETIMFFDGNVKLYCGSGTACSVNDRRSIIVKNGTFYIKSNITTLTSAAAQTNGQLFLGVMNDTGLASLTIDPSNPDITNDNKNGWMLVDPSVTNIDAFLFAQGPMVSYDEVENIFYSKTLTTERKLRNQLYINGSILTLNTITGSRQVTPECPYMVDNCTAEVAQMFDLVYTRRFTLGSISLFPPFDTTDTRMVPYHPDGPNIAKRAGGVTGTVTYSGNELRSIAEPDYYAYPMLIERDTRWNTVPSRLFQVNP